MPVPAAAYFAPRPGWDLTAAAATWWLRRSTGRKARYRHPPLGLLAHLWTRALHECAIEPLTVLRWPTTRHYGRCLTTLSSVV